MKIDEIRKDFPYLKSEGLENLVYLDNAATSQKPRQVIEALNDYYITNNANPNRGAYKLSYNSTLLYENTRKKVKSFIKADSSSEIIFLRNATEALNLIAYSYGLNNLRQGDEILISIAEHHSNLVTWQYVAEKTGARLRYFYLDDDYGLDIRDYKQKLNNKTKIVAFTAASNVLSAHIPVKEMIDMARKTEAKIIIDGAQYTPHHSVNLQDWDPDFFVFSGHKLLAPMGVGVLYGRRELLEDMPPFMYGGDMIEYVYECKTSYAPIPEKFEAGTQDVAAVIGLGAAIDYINSIGMENIEKREEELTEYCIEKMKKLDYIELYYPEKNAKGANITFNIKGVHPHDVASIMDYHNIAIRSGHHCTQPLHRYLGVNSSCRVSFAFYNTFEEIDKFLDGLNKVKELMISGS